MKLYNCAYELAFNSLTAIRIRQAKRHNHYKKKIMRYFHSFAFEFHAKVCKTRTYNQAVNSRLKHHRIFSHFNSTILHGIKMHAEKTIIWLKKETTRKKLNSRLESPQFNVFFDL